MTKTKWYVDLVEYERGWGSRVDETRVFDDYDEAKQFQEEFNSHNTEDEVPDWYMVAKDPLPQK